MTKITFCDLALPNMKYDTCEKLCFICF